MTAIRAPPIRNGSLVDETILARVATVIRKIFAAGYLGIVFLFCCCGFALIVFGAIELWQAIRPSGDLSLTARFNSILECIAMLTIAVAALELGQEEVQREAHMSAPTRVRRFLSRFLVVVVVSLAVEALVATFQFVHEKPHHLPQAAMIAFGAAALLAAWGLFIKLNKGAEELEPEAMAAAKREDSKVEA